MFKQTDKKQIRLRRVRRARIKIKELGVYRLSVHRSPRHIYAQIIAPSGSQVITAASTLMEEVKQDLQGKYTGNVEAAKVVGKVIAKRAIEKGVTKVAFDRAGFKYHGRIKALADAARENGLEF